MIVVDLWRLAITYFMVYKKVAEDNLSRSISQILTMDLDFERIAAAVNNDPDVFKISLLWPIIEKLQTAARITLHIPKVCE